MIDKRVRTLAEAVAGIPDGAIILCAGFGGAGLPDALCEAGAQDNGTIGDPGHCFGEGAHPLVDHCVCPRSERHQITALECEHRPRLIR